VSADPIVSAPTSAHDARRKLPSVDAALQLRVSRRCCPPMSVGWSWTRCGLRSRTLWARSRYPMAAAGAAIGYRRGGARRGDGTGERAGRMRPTGRPPKDGAAGHPASEAVARVLAESGLQPTIEHDVAERTSLMPGRLRAALVRLREDGRAAPAGELWFAGTGPGRGARGLARRCASVRSRSPICGTSGASDGATPWRWPPISTPRGSPCAGVTCASCVAQGSRAEPRGGATRGAAGAWWPNSSSKRAGRGLPPPGRFDSYAAPLSLDPPFGKRDDVRG